MSESTVESVTVTEVDRNANTAGATAADERREQFRSDVAAMKLKGGKTGSGGAVQPLGLAAMIIGVIGAFALYALSLSQTNSLNIASFQIMAIGFLGVTVVGAALYITGSISKLLRLWLLRQLIEQQGHVDQITDALSGRERDLTQI